MDKKEQYSAAFIIIGNEILSGRTQDKNLAFIASELNDSGIRLMEVRVVLDIEDDIIYAVNELRNKYDYVFTSGGIGPTHDDITSESIAKAFGTNIYRDPEAEKRLREYYPPEKINDARLKMADIPYGATLLDNPVTSAPGFKVENVYVLAGVPKIMQLMFLSFKHTLSGGKPMLMRTITVKTSEGNIANDLSIIQENNLDIEIGSYPFIKNDVIGTSLVLRGLDENLLNKAYNELKSYIDGKNIPILEEIV